MVKASKGAKSRKSTLNAHTNRISINSGGSRVSDKKGSLETEETAGDDRESRKSIHSGLESLDKSVKSGHEARTEKDLETRKSAGSVHKPRKSDKKISHNVRKSDGSGNETQKSIEGDRDSTGSGLENRKSVGGGRKSRKSDKSVHSTRSSAKSVRSTRSSAKSDHESIKMSGSRETLVSAASGNGVRVSFRRGHPDGISVKGGRNSRMSMDSTNVTRMSISSNNDIPMSIDSSSATRLSTLNNQVRKSLRRSTKSGIRPRLSVAEIRRTLRATDDGRRTLRSTYGLRHFVSELAHLPGQKFKNADRVKWQHGIDSTFSLIAFAVDTANLSRFPYFCFAYGGSAFLIPYFLFLIFSAFPLLYMELLLGQFLQQGVISVWKIAPLFKGIGYCICTILILTLSYYLSLLAWSLIFIWESISLTGRPLPWSTCDNLWNTLKCVPLSSQSNYSNPSNSSNASLLFEITGPGTEFFKGRVLRYYTSQYADPYIIFNKSLNGNKTFGFPSDEGMGDPILDLSLCLIFISVCLFIFVISEIRITGKFVWLTATIPLLLLFIILIKTLTHEGAVSGITALITPNFTQLKSPETWAVASIQVFYSTGAGFGVHLTHASHNNFNHNVFRDAIITAVINSLTSIIGALVIFANLGNKAHDTNKTISEVTTIGVDLVFDSYAEGVGLLSPDDARFSAIMFYSMIFIIGFDTALGGVQAVSIGFKDEFPQLLRTSATSFILAITAFAFVFNLISVTRGGVWMYTFMDNYAAGNSLILGIFFQTFVVTWIWGMDELCDAAIVMTGRKPGLYLRLCWKYIAPLSLLVVLVLSIKFSSVPAYNGEELPQSGQTIGNLITYLPFISIPIYVLYQSIFYKKGNSFRERLRFLLSPENEHSDISLNGNAGDRFTWRHFFFLGGFNYSSPVRVSPENEHSTNFLDL